MTAIQKITYIFLNNLARVALRVYYRKIEVEGKERIPKDTATIVCPNHPNTMIDPVLMANVMPGWIHFLANYGLFKHPVSRFLMSKVFFSIPVKRPKDVPRGEKVNNLATIKICTQVLQDGGTIFMGPEATSYSYRRIRPMKDGIARIALATAKRKRFQSGLAIMPMGTNYSQPDAFRSQLLLKVGQPIWVDDYAADYNSGDKTVAIEKVMTEIRSQLESLTLHTEDEIEAQYVAWLKTLAATEGHFRGFREGLAWEKRMLPHIRAWREAAPTSFEESWQALRHYFMTLSLQNTTDAALVAPPTKQAWLWVFYPFYAAGVLLNAYWWIPEWVLAKVQPYQSYVAMLRILVGVVVIPSCMLIVGTLFYQWIGWSGLLAYVLLAFLLGLCIRPYQKWIKNHKESQAAYQDTQWRTQLLHQRQHILQYLLHVEEKGNFAAKAIY